jgi:hypothetical protein
MDNAVCLCKGCHMKFTYDPIGWEDWVEEKFPGRLAELKVRAKQGVTPAHLEAVVASLEVTRGR